MVQQQSMHITQAYKKKKSHTNGRSVAVASGVDFGRTESAITMAAHDRYYKL